MGLNLHLPNPRTQRLFREWMLWISEKDVGNVPFKKMSELEIKPSLAMFLDNMRESIHYFENNQTNEKN